MILGGPAVTLALFQGFLASILDPAVMALSIPIIALLIPVVAILVKPMTERSPRQGLAGEGVATEVVVHDHLIVADEHLRQRGADEARPPGQEHPLGPDRLTHLAALLGVVAARRPRGRHGPGRRAPAALSPHPTLARRQQLQTSRRRS